MEQRVKNIMHDLNLNVSPEWRDRLSSSAAKMLSLPACATDEELATAAGQFRDMEPKWLWLKLAHSVRKFHHQDYISSPTNLLTVDPDDADWEVRLNHRLALLLAGEGRPMVAEPSYWGWIDAEAAKHIKADCRVAEVTQVQEDAWDEFTDTFDENGSARSTGLIGDAACGCGWWRGRYRWEGDATHLILSVTAAEEAS